MSIKKLRTTHYKKKKKKKKHIYNFQGEKKSQNKIINPKKRKTRTHDKRERMKKTVPDGTEAWFQGGSPGGCGSALFARGTPEH